MATSLPSRYRLLYTEPDQEFRERVGSYLTGFGFDLTSVGTAAEARVLLQLHRFDLVLLDLPFPSGDNWRLLEDVSRRGRPPMLVTSSNGEEADRILAIEAGADDYIVKPFNPRELVARLRSIVRRAGAELPSTTRRVAVFNGWSVDIHSRHARSAARAVELTGGEMAVLIALMDHPRQVLTRADLLQSMGRDDGDVFDRTVDVLVSRLRKKLERDALHPEIVQTVRGGGYYFGAVVEWDTEALPVHERSVNKMND